MKSLIKVFSIIALLALVVTIVLGIILKILIPWYSLYWVVIYIFSFAGLAFSAYRMTQKGLSPPKDYGDYPYLLKKK